MPNSNEEMPNGSPLSAPRIEALLAHSDWIGRLARQLVGDPNEADEVVQEAWVQALSRPPAHDGNLKGWLASVVRRSAYRRSRAAFQRRDHEERSRAPGNSRTPEDLVNQVALQRRLQGAILELPETYRDTLLLRYFEDLPPRKIAARLGTPVATIHSRLHRGTELLRKGLDVSSSSRQEWMLALVPLAAEATVGEGVAASIGLGVAGSLGALIMVGGAMVTVRTPWESASGGPDSQTAALAGAQDTSTQSDSTDERVAAQDGPGDVPAPKGGRSPIPVRPPGSDAQGTSAPPERASEDPVRSSLLSGVTLELDGIPAPHVRMRRQSPHVVRWQSGDRGWISGPGGAVKISAEEEQRLRDDPDYRRRRLADLPHREEWRATLLDAPLPGRDQSTGADGTFGFDIGEPIAAEAVEVADADWVQVARGRRTLPLEPVSDEPVSDGAPGTPPPTVSDTVWIVARSHRIEGEVRGADGAPVRSGTVRVVFDTRSALQRLPFEFEAKEVMDPTSMSVSQGLFLIRKAPVAAGAMLEFSAPGHRIRRLPIPRALPDPFVVELAPKASGETWTVAGTVRDAEGEAVAKALVALGGSRTTANARGQFELTAEDVRAGDDLIAAGQENSTGRGAAVRRDFGMLLMGGEAPDRLELVLDDAGGKVRGRLHGLSGRADQWVVELDDPTLLEFSFRSVEARAAGRRDPVAVSADGTFELTGLLTRTYTLRLWSPKTGLVHLEHGVRPGDELEITPDSSMVRVSGKVEGGAGATVAVLHRYFSNASGSGGLQDSGPARVCGPSGEFRLEAMPSEGAYLNVTLPSGQNYQVPVELIDRGSEAILSPPLAALLEVRADYFEEPHALLVESAAGSHLPVEALGEPTLGRSILSVRGRFPRILIPMDAANVVVVDPEGLHTVLPLSPIRGGLLSVRFR